MTGGVTQQDGIEYRKYGTKALAQPPRIERGPVKVTSREEAELTNRATTEGAWAVHGNTAYLSMPIPPMKPLQEGGEPVLQARTLHAEACLERAARWLEKGFGVKDVHGIIDHEDGGSIVLQLDVQQYDEKIAPRAQARTGALR